MRLHPHFSPFVICNVDGENLVLFCTEKTIYRMTSLHAFNRLSCDSLCHIWLVLMTFDTPTSYFTNHISFLCREKAFFVCTPKRYKNRIWYFLLWGKIDSFMNLKDIVCITLADTSCN